ncbi:MAG: hypothetical protein PUI39_03020 [Prevotella sp.]|nr:hypothetical protein [Prevotella sp.]
MADSNILSDFGIKILEQEIDDVIFQTNEFLCDATFTGSQGPFWWLLVVTAFLPFYPLVTNSLSITSDFCLSPLFIRRDKNGTKPENKISKNTFEPIKSLRHIVLSGAKFLQTSAMKTCFQIAECS